MNEGGKKGGRKEREGRMEREEGKGREREGEKQFWG